MKVLVAGATGVLGRQLVPLLNSAGHDVIGLARTEERSAAVRELGAEVALADLLDRGAVARAVQRFAPDAVVHMATAIPPAITPRRIAKQFVTTNRLRVEGTRNLLDAADVMGVRRVITQAVAFAYDPGGAGLAVEDDPLWQRPPREFAPVLDALRGLEARTRGSKGVVLRFGHLYGPGTAFARDGSFTAQVRAGKVPLVAGGASVFSFTHTYDAATAVLAALDKDVSGPINVVDDDPAPMSTWLPYLAELLGASRPRRAPAPLVRIAAGGWGLAYLTRLRGADNARAKLLLDWKPRYPSWRAGFGAVTSIGPHSSEG